jgi:nucleoside-diphosphate-sugar epimerase
MRVLITGAGGFVGRALVARLLRDGLADTAPEAIRVVLLDRRLPDVPRPSNVEVFEGDLLDRELLARALSADASHVFHLASVPGGAAEADFELGLRVNLQATVELLERLRAAKTQSRLVFASTIGVYGMPLPSVIAEDTIAAPSLSYGAHKLAGEVLLADYGRRGYVDGVSLRLPGIVARPPDPSGLLSAFMSDMLRVVAAGRRFTCPVAADGVAWWMSRSCAVDNLMTAATLSRTQLERRRTYLLPALRASMADVVAAIGAVYGVDAETLVTYRDDACLRAQFASYPPLECPASLEAGFHHDGTVEALVTRALDE